MNTPLHYIPTVVGPQQIKIIAADGPPQQFGDPSGEPTYIAFGSPEAKPLTHYLSVVMDGNARPVDFFLREDEPSAVGSALRRYVEVHQDYTAQPDRSIDPPMWDLYQLCTTEDGLIYYTCTRPRSN